MKTCFKAALLCSAIFAASINPMTPAAFAQSASGSAFASGEVPPKPPKTVATYDFNAIDNLIVIRQRIGDLTAIISNQLKAMMDVPLANLDKNVKTFLDTYTATTNVKMDSLDANVKSMLDLLTTEFGKPTPAALGGGGSIPPLFNTPVEQAERVEVPNFGSMTEKLRTSGDVGYPPLTPIMADAITRYKLEDTIIVDKSGPASLYVTSDARSHLASSNVTASAIAELAFKSASVSTGRLNTYIGAIETSTDIKTSIDLNTRVLLELVQQNNELLRTTAAMASVNTNYMMLNLRTD